MSFKEAINNISDSINEERTALTGLMKKETEKIQFFINNNATPDELLKVNESTNKMIDEINKLENILNNKFLLIEPFLKNDIF